MSKYFKDAAGLAAFISFVLAIIVVIAIIVGGFAFAVLGLFIVFFPLVIVILSPLRRWLDRSKALEALLKKAEDKEDELRSKLKAKKSGNS